MFEDEERAARAVGVEEGVVVRRGWIAEGTEKFGEGERREGFAPGGGPFGEVGEVHVGGEILAAGVEVDVGAVEPLLEEVGADGAVGAAMVEAGGGGAVVDGEEPAGFPGGHPAGEPVAVGVVDFDFLAVGMGVGEGGGIGQRRGGEEDFAGRGVEGDSDFAPAFGGVAEAADGEGVDQFVREDDRVSAGGAEGGGGVFVPDGALAELFALEAGEAG